MSPLSHQSIQGLPQPQPLNTQQVTQLQVWSTTEAEILEAALSQMDFRAK